MGYFVNSLKPQKQSQLNDPPTFSPVDGLGKSKQLHLFAKTLHVSWITYTQKIKW